MGLDLEVFSIETPQLVAATPLILGRLILLNIADKVPGILKFIFLEKPRIAEKLLQVITVTVNVLGEEPIGEQFRRIERQVLSCFALQLFLHRIKDVLAEGP